jgi:hypothetical protein
MKRISQEEYDVTYRVFNYVEGLVGPYYGRRTFDQTMEFISANRWIMFPVNGIDSLREGTVYPMPNVYISQEEEHIADNGAGKLDGYSGVTYHNVEAMIAFRDLLKRRSKPLISIISNFTDDWSVEIVRKTKTDCKDSVPRYETFRAFKPSTVTPDDLRQALVDSDRTLLQRGDPYPGSGNPVLWSVSVFSVWKTITLDSFDADVKKVFDVFFRLLSCR